MILLCLQIGFCPVVAILMTKCLELRINQLSNQRNNQGNSCFQAVLTRNSLQFVKKLLHPGKLFASPQARSNGVLSDIESGLSN